MASCSPICCRCLNRKDGVQMRDGFVGVFGELVAEDREALEPEYGSGG